jgi:DNA-3-methyladenine glycosylase II
MKTSSFLLKAVPPFRLDYTAWALRRRTENTIDRIEGESYKRLIVIDDLSVEIVAYQPDIKKSEIEVLVKAKKLLTEIRKKRLRRYSGGCSEWKGT